MQSLFIQVWEAFNSHHTQLDGIYKFLDWPLAIWKCLNGSLRAALRLPSHHLFYYRKWTKKGLLAGVGFIWIFSGIWSLLISPLFIEGVFYVAWLTINESISAFRCWSGFFVQRKINVSSDNYLVWWEGAKKRLFVLMLKDRLIFGSFLGIDYIDVYRKLAFGFTWLSTSVQET